MRILAQTDGHEDFWPAYTDILMITSLVLVLLAATFALTRQDDRIKQELEKRKVAFEERFNMAMAPEIAKGLVALASPPGERQTISFSDQLLFEAGDAELKRQAGKASLSKLVSLIQHPLKENTLFQRIQVDGHTDPDPIKTSQYPSNWHLSGARATSVLYFFVKAGLPPERMTATGHAQYHPFDPEGKRISEKSRMRRIEIVLLYPADWIGQQLQRQAEKRTVQ
jgi:chemotaxis protein MotB